MRLCVFLLLLILADLFGLFAESRVEVLELVLAVVDLDEYGTEELDASPLLVRRVRQLLEGKLGGEQRDVNPDVALVQLVYVLPD